jgi:hypothetical protein
MRTKNASWVVLVIVLIAGIGFFLYQHRSEHAALTRLAALTVDEEVLNADIERLSRLVAQREEQSKHNESSLVKAMPVPASADAVPPPPTPDQVRANTIRAWLGLRNSHIYAKLGLNAEEIRTFEEQETDHWLRMEDIVATARAKALGPTDPVIVALQKEETIRHGKMQWAMLGEEGFKAFREYHRTLPARSLANALAGNVLYSDPLSAQQGEQLTQILASNSASYSKGGPVKAADINVTTALNQIQTVLSPEQFSVFKKTYLASQAGDKLKPFLTTAQSAKAAAPGMMPSAQKQ